MTLRLRPVMEIDGFKRSLEISGELTAADLEAALSVLADEAQDVVGELLDRDGLIATGGLELHDGRTGVTITPGCCSGLEDWRTWAEALDGRSPWMGHDPSPSIEVDGDLMRVWQNGGLGESRSGCACVELPVAALPPLLLAVQSDLMGFLRRVEQWADAVAPTLSARLVAKVDDALAISAPLDLPGEAEVTPPAGSRHRGEEA
ncbi:hypothetical protein [Nonomuraea dietziae]|uniref:hypothetical protein n=1 Tax=Nonomuraea dietziae TaxID=65515 RepID=UPI0033F5B5B7